MKNMNYLWLVICLKFINAMVIVILWDWFVVPLLHLPPLNIPYAIGLGALYFLFSGVSSLKMEEDIAKNLQRSYLSPFLALIVGWLAHFFI